ncbi:hypothetical protein TNCT_650101 [Trichonephila clavata]|uniref:Uncharacterized protein n=1 Tax=Trichonephila clavata TaxID=2740835 RepID=A0A8X6J0A8_TRICU|nr:hypothetical protein TNCT_650101 [Trichonephila clavata]
MLLRVHAVKPSLHSPYRAVFKPGEKNFNLLINRKEFSISVGRIKSAHLNADSPFSIQTSAATNSKTSNDSSVLLSNP